MIELLNIKPGDVFQQAIVLIHGVCVVYSCPLVQVLDSSGQSIEWSIKNGHFKAFVRLVKGKNEITMTTDTCTLRLVVFRSSQKAQSARLVRVLYAICQDDPLDGEFQSDKCNKKSDALDRISLNVELLQSFISESIYKQYETRKSFNLITDLEDDHSHTCEVYYTKLSISKALEMSSSDIYHHLAQELANDSDYYRPEVKYIVVLSFTRYEPTSSSQNIFDSVKGFCAMGAEWLAVYGTPCLFTWSDCLSNLEKCFSDRTLIDTTRFMNDSAFRNEYWACYSTTLGSLLHEFSHILDLGHDTSGIMWRGFDDLYTFFTVSETCSCQSYLSSKNNIIQKMSTFKNETENKLAGYKETFIDKYATYTNQLGQLTNEFVYSLKFINHNTRNQSRELEHLDKCYCQKTCFYTRSNLCILFHHKWLTGWSDDSAMVEQSELSSIKVHTKSENVLEVISRVELALLELRTSRRSVTFHYTILTESRETWQSDLAQVVSHTGSPEFIYLIELNKKSLRDQLSQLDTYNSNVGFESSVSKSVDIYSIEIFLLDLNGVIYKQRLSLA